MRFSARYPLALCALLTSFATPAAAALDPTGLWLTENKRSAIEVYKCGADNTLLCGKIGWIIEGGMQFDEKNPDATKHAEPLCGKTIMWDLKQGTSDPNYWGQGKVYKADEGDTYDARLTMESENTAEVRGFMGMSMFGKSQDWVRVSAKDYPACKPAKK